MGRVQGKSAVVTGAAQGLGAAISAALARDGAKVLLTDINVAGAAAQAERLNAELGSGTAFSLRHDVTNAQDWYQVVLAAQDLMGGLSILVNNAGIVVSGDIEKCDFTEWKRSFSINVDSVFLGCQAALPIMKESQPASIINISSISGLIASNTMPAYNTSKAAVWMLTKSIALHCAKGKWDIRCNSVHPTFVDTPILDDISADNSIEKMVMMEKLSRQIPLGRVGVPQDVASAVLYLASDESRFVTGAELKVDGGISAM